MIKGAAKPASVRVNIRAYPAQNSSRLPGSAALTLVAEGQRAKLNQNGERPRERK